MADVALALDSPRLDHPADFVTTPALPDRADLADLLDAITAAVQTIEAASAGVTAMVKLVQSAVALVAQAGATNSLAGADDLAAALTTLRSQAHALASNLPRAQVRQDFAIAMINMLPDIADSLTPIARDQEAANLLALQTRQQQSATALSLAVQASQSVLRSFEQRTCQSGGAHHGAEG
jgi:hypothetical protein